MNTMSARDGCSGKRLLVVPAGGGITAGTFLGPERHPAPAACCGGEVSSSRAEARLLPVHGVREDFPDAASHGRSLQRARTH